LVAVDLAPAAQNSYRLFNDNAAAAWQDFKTGNAVMISEPLAYRRQLKTGDKLTLMTATGAKAFSVAGIFHDYSSEHGRILINRNAFRQFWQDDSITSVAIYADTKQNLDQLKGQIEQTTASLQPLRIRSNRTIFELTLAVFDRTFAITNILRLLAILIAFVGILSALMALQLERSREFATLRTLGMTLGQITRLTCLQTGFMGFFAGLIAIPMGLILAILLIFVINRRAFGWSLPFQVNFEIFYQCIGLAMAGALLASVYPLWKQRRINLAQALRSE
jgi:putative ABC transport system permease protein